MLKLKSVIPCVAGIVIASAVCVAQATPASYSHAELKKMMRGAQTAERYRTLADYFGSQEVNYEQRAAQQRHEWLQLSRGYCVPFLRYPSLADAARNRSIYFANKAQQMSEQADRFEAMAAGAAE